VDNGALKYICLWMVLLLLFFLLLYGVHQFFFSRMESRTTKKTSLTEHAIKNTSVKKDNATERKTVSFYSEYHQSKPIEKENRTLIN